MAHGSRRLVWILAASAAVAAQTVSSAFCRSCDLPCCAVSADGPAVGGESAAEPARGCPLCAEPAAPLARCSGDAEPCRCQLAPRQDRPLARARGISPAVDQADQAAVPAVADLEVPQSLGVSREYLAASLAVPIRPVRILFGVWRN